MKKILMTLGGLLVLLVLANPCWSATGTINLDSEINCGTESSPTLPSPYGAQLSYLMTERGCLARYRWTFVESGGAAVDTGVTAVITGRIVGVKFVETSITAATTVKLLDAAGRDVLQGIFTDTEASATATADNHYRVPVDDTSGGYIYLHEETVYIDISSGNGAETGYVDVIVQLP